MPNMCTTDRWRSHTPDATHINTSHAAKDKGSLRQGNLYCKCSRKLQERWTTWRCAKVYATITVLHCLPLLRVSVCSDLFLLVSPRVARAWFVLSASPVIYTASDTFLTRMMARIPNDFEFSYRKVDCWSCQRRVTNDTLATIHWQYGVTRLQDDKKKLNEI